MNITKTTACFPRWLNNKYDIKLKSTNWSAYHIIAVRRCSVYDTVYSAVQFFSWVTSILLVPITTNFYWALKQMYNIPLHPCESQADTLNNSLCSINMFSGKNRKKEKGLAASLPPPLFLFHYKSHHFFFFFLSQALVWCAEMHWEPCDANKAKVARIYPSERQSARQAPVCLSASLCVSHLIGNN